MSTLSINLLNSNSLKTSLTSDEFVTLNLNSLGLKSTGTSRIIVASFLESNPNSLFDSIFSFNLPFNLSVLANNFSILPYSAINFLAVLSPTPGSPGILSAESPFIPKKSIT